MFHPFSDSPEVQKLVCSFASPVLWGVAISALCHRRSLPAYSQLVILIIPGTALQESITHIPARPRSVKHVRQAMSMSECGMQVCPPVIPSLTNPYILLHLLHSPVYFPAVLSNAASFLYAAFVS